MKPGDTVWVRVFKADGSPHRWWQVVIEDVDAACIVAITKPGNIVYHNASRFPSSEYRQKHFIRNFYYPGRCHTLLEVYRPDGALNELYADICSPVQLIEGEIHLIDHELDVSQMAGDVPRIVDQDEFAEAAEQYGYSEEFVRESYALAEKLLRVLAEWQPRGV
jgi:protein associated with RNAse G/E